MVPRNALDVLAQQIVAIAVAAESAAGAKDGRRGRDGPAAGADQDGAVSVDELHALVRRTYSYSELSRELLENVLDMLDGRYPSQEFGELRARIVWDRLAGTIRARRGSRQLAVANAGTIPDRGLYAVTLPDGRRVGELDEEMVYEARAGADLPARRLQLADRGDRARPRDRDAGARGAGRGAVLEGRLGGTREGARRGDRRVLALGRGPGRRRPCSATTTSTSAPRATCSSYLREQQQATRVLPSERTIVLERFRDEIGDWRLCVLSPFGGRVHAAWALALSARMHERFGVEADAIAADDGIVLHLPDLDARRRRVAALGRRAAAAGPRGGRAGGHGRARRLGPVRGALPRERLAGAADPARLSRAAARRCGSSA